MPTFTQRHYEYLAKILSETDQENILMIYFLADVFEKDNPRFDREKFLSKSLRERK